MPKVFISYRRDDSAGHTGRINEHVERAVGKDNVFQDVTDIAPGVQWDAAVAEAMAQSDLQLVVIGPRFLDETNGPRLHEEDDLLRREIAAGLRSASTRVVPILVGGATLPSADQLPAELARLPTRQDFEVRDRSFDADVRSLLKHLGLKRIRPLAIAGGLVGLLAVIILAIVLFSNGDDPEDTTATTSTSTTDATTTTSTAPPAEAEPFQLDDYVGVDANAAEATLESMELGVRRTLEQSVEVAAGNVISHNPAAGATVVAGDQVTLVVSSGHPGVEVPETEKTLLDAAIARIENDQLTTMVTPVASGTIGVDRVVRTEPSAGTVVPLGSTVEILVSTGPASGCPTLFPSGTASVGTDGTIPTDAEGNPTGFEPPLIQMVIEEMCGSGIGINYRSLTAAERFSAVAAGEVNLLPTSKRSGDVSLLYTTPHVLLDGETPRGLAVRNGLSTERLQLNAALLEVIESGRWLELHREWLGEPAYTTNDMLSTPLAED